MIDTIDKLLDVVKICKEASDADLDGTLDLLQKVTELETIAEVYSNPETEGERVLGETFRKAVTYIKEFSGLLAERQEACDNKRTTVLAEILGGNP